MSESPISFQEFKDQCSKVGITEKHYLFTGKNAIGGDGYRAMATADNRLGVYFVWYYKNRRNGLYSWDVSMCWGDIDAGQALHTSGSSLKECYLEIISCLKIMTNSLTKNADDMSESVKGLADDA